MEAAFGCLLIHLFANSVSAVFIYFEQSIPNFRFSGIRPAERRSCGDRAGRCAEVPGIGRLRSISFVIIAGVDHGEI